MNILHQFLLANEGIWLFYVLLTSVVLELATLGILIAEFKYDKAYNESKSKKRARSKNKVKVIIDSEGNARIAQSPNNVDVSIEHEGTSNE